MGTFIIVLSFIVYECAVIALIYPKALGLSYRSHSVLIWLASIVLLGLGSSLSFPETDGRDPGRSRPRTTASPPPAPSAPSRAPATSSAPRRSAAPATRDTLAEVWARTANASLDMPMAPFFLQMPDDLKSTQWSTSAAGRRVHTMTFRDDSVVVTYWKPSPVSGGGLLLDFIDKIGR